MWFVAVGTITEKADEAAGVALLKTLVLKRLKPLCHKAFQAIQPQKAEKRVWQTSIAGDRRDDERNLSSIS